MVDNVTKDRLDRAFRAFSQHGDYITFDTYTGQAQALAEASGKDPESPAVRDLTDQLRTMWDRFSDLTHVDDEGRIDRDAWNVLSEKLFEKVMAVGPDDDVAARPVHPRPFPGDRRRRRRPDHQGRVRRLADIVGIGG